MADLSRYAIVRDGVVENVTVWDGVTEWSPPEGTEAVLDKSGTAQIGGTHHGKNFVAPPVPVLSKDEVLLNERRARLADLQEVGWEKMTANERIEAQGLQFELSERVQRPGNARLP